MKTSLLKWHHSMVDSSILCLRSAVRVWPSQKVWEIVFLRDDDKHHIYSMSVMAGCLRGKYAMVSWRDPIWSVVGLFLHDKVVHGRTFTLKSLPWVMFMCFAVFCLARTIHYTSIFSYWANQELAPCCKAPEIMRLATVCWNLSPSMPGQCKLLPYFYCVLRCRS